MVGSIVIPPIVGVSEKVLTPVPVEVSEVKARDVPTIPCVVVIPEPPATEIAGLTRTVIVVVEVDPTESVAVIVSL